MKKLIRKLMFCSFFIGASSAGMAQSFEQESQSSVNERDAKIIKMNAYVEENKNYTLTKLEQDAFNAQLNADDDHGETVDVDAQQAKFTRELLAKRFLSQNSESMENLSKPYPFSYPEPCYKGDFESGSLTTFEGYWNYGTTNAQCDQIPLNVPGSYVPVVMSGLEQELLLTTDIPDPNVPAAALRQTFGGSNGAIRINPDDGGDRDISVLRKNFSTPTTGDQVVSFNAAIVFQHPHNDSYDPFLTARILDASGAVVGGPICITTTSADIEWNPFVYGGTNALWMDWKCFNVPYFGNMGENYVLEISVGDCAWGGHGGYAYVDDICNKVCEPINTDCCDAAAGLVLSWSEVPGAVHYEVAFVFNDTACCSTSTVGPIGLSILTTENIMMPPAGPSDCYSWAVRAIYADGSSTGFSTRKCDCGPTTVDPDPDPCPAPENLSCQIVSSGHYLSWDSVPGALGGYTIEITYNDPSCGCTGPVTTETITTYDTHTVIPDMSLCFSWKVKTVCNTALISSWSEVKCSCGPATPAPCLAPENLSCQIVNNARYLSWDAVVGAFGGYMIEITYNDPSCGCTGPVTSETITTFDTHAFIPDMSLCFSWKVRAVCTGTTVSSWSEVKCSCDPITPDPCPAPSNMSCQIVNNARYLSWGAVPSALGGYNIEITYNDPSCGCVGPVTTETITTYDTYAFVPDMSLCFSWKVRAVCNSALVSSWSEVKCSCDPSTSTMSTGEIGSNNSTMKVSVVPNPADEFVSFLVEGVSSISKATIAKVMIISSTGAEVHTSTIRMNETEKINVSQLNAGVYIYKIIQENVVIDTGKIIIK